jgi:hypothetical protein
MQHRVLPRTVYEATSRSGSHDGSEGDRIARRRQRERPRGPWDRRNAVRESSSAAWSAVRLARASPVPSESLRSDDPAVTGNPPPSEPRASPRAI